MSGDHAAALREVLSHVRPLVLNSTRVVESTLRPAGLTVGMRAVLEVLAEHGAATVPAIADQLDLARQGVQRHVDELESRGHVEAQTNPIHRRSVLIAPTPSGTAVAARIARDDAHQLARMAADCTHDEIMVAVKVLASLSRDVRERARSLRDLDGATR